MFFEDTSPKLITLQNLDKFTLAYETTYIGHHQTQVHILSLSNDREPESSI